MSGSGLIGRVSSFVLKGPVLGSLSKRLVKSNSSVYVVQLPFYHQLASGTFLNRELSAPFRYGRKSAFLVDFTQKFSTSSCLLAQHKSHDHSKLWTFERVLSALLLPLVPGALIYPSQTMDTLLALTIVLHAHLGLEAVVVDYVRPILFGEMVPKLCLGLLYLFSIVTLAGLLNLIYNDAGLANAIITIWKNKNMMRPLHHLYPHHEHWKAIEYWIFFKPKKTFYPYSRSAEIILATCKKSNLSKLSRRTFTYEMKKN